MIARIVARLRHADELTAARVELRQLNESLGKEQLTTARLTSEVRELADEVERLQLIADEAERLHRVIELGRAGIAVVT